MKIKLLFVKLVLFALPFVICFFYVENRLSRIPNSFNAKRNNFERQLDSIEVIVLGSSHEVFGINPVYFSVKGFNLANAGQDLYFSKELLMKYLTKLPRLKMVIIDADYFTFNYSLCNSGSSWRSAYYYRFWDIKGSPWDKLDMGNYSLLALYTLPTVQSFIKNGFDTNLITNLAYNGWIKNDTNDGSSISDKEGEERVHFHDKFIDNKKYNKQIRGYLEGLLNELKGKEIDIEFITTPVFSTYSKYCNKKIVEENEEYVDSLCKKYNCWYKNYFTDTRFVKKDFYDNDHLDFIGAQKLSKAINEEIINPFLKFKDRPN